MLTRLGYGLIVWVIPYVAAIPLLALQQRDPTLFKTIMIVIGSTVGSALAAHYFMGVQTGFLREGLLLASTWLALNWLLDVVALLPFTRQTIDRYFLEIGLRYLAIVAPTIAIGAVLARKCEARAPAGPLTSRPADNG